MIDSKTVAGGLVPDCSAVMAQSAPLIAVLANLQSSSVQSSPVQRSIRQREQAGPRSIIGDSGSTTVSIRSESRAPLY